jgi:hypothetical protein
MATEQPAAGAGNMLTRIVAILTRPRQEWEKIGAEPMTPANILLRWVLPLALIKPIVMVVRTSTLGLPLYGGAVAPTPGYLVALFVTTWLAAILATWLLGLVVDALAPAFGGQKDSVGALKVAAFGSVALFLSNIFLISANLLVTALAIVGLYSFYLIYEGLPAVMKTPREKAILFVVALFVIATLLQFVTGYAGNMIADNFRPVLPAGFNWR